MPRIRAKASGIPGDSVNMGVGQGFLQVTPMQNAHIAAVLAAKGEVFQPRL